MFRELALLIPLALALSLGGHAPVAAASDFEHLARTLERELDLEREHIPAKWLVNTALFFSRSEVKSLDIAVFESLRSSNQAASMAFLRTVRQNVGPDWSPWVQSWSRIGGEHTAIYARPAGRNWELLIATVEPDEATLVRIKVSKHRMLAYLNDHDQVTSDTKDPGD